MQFYFWGVEEGSFHFRYSSSTNQNIPWVPHECVVRVKKQDATKPAFADDDMDALIAESRAAIKGFGASLKAELVAAIEAGGPEHAIGVCNMVAPGVALERSNAFSA